MNVRQATRAATAASYRLGGRTWRWEYVLFPQGSHSVYGLDEGPRGLLPGTYLRSRAASQRAPDRW